MGLVACSQSGAADLPDNPPGWAWLVEPMPPSSTSWSTRGILGLTGQSFDGGLDIVIALEPAEGSTYRVVAFDTSGNRHELKGVGSGNGNTSLKRFSTSPELLSFSEVACFGVEVLSQTGWVEASVAASARASAAGIRPLPLPIVGKPYEFELMDIDGQVIRSDDYLGKIVVVDCWATWCTPCMNKMPALKLMHERWGEAGLAVVGVNYDHDIGKAKGIVADLQLPWSQVSVPPDHETRQLWWEVSSIAALPRLLILDRNGTLVADSKNPKDLEVVLGGIFEEKH